MAGTNASPDQDATDSESGEEEEEDEEALDEDEEDEDEKPLVINTNYSPIEPPPSPPMASSIQAANPITSPMNSSIDADSSNSALQRQESFQIRSAEHESILSNEISAVIGLNNGHNNGHSKMNGYVNGKSTPPHEDTSNQDQPSVGVDSSAISPEELKSLKLRNQNMRQMIYKEVKRPGKDHKRLFEMLRTLHGPQEIRKEYIGEVIWEARRFKRTNLAEILEKKLEELVMS